LKSYVKRLLGGTETEPPLPFLPNGERLYCIGDIHGRLDLLLELHRAIAVDSAGFAGGKTLVYLGDYIDRGDQSKEVIDLLLEQPMQGFAAVHILGNHEQTLLDFLRHPREVIHWLTYGGRNTLQSYGVPLWREVSPQHIDEVRDELESKLPRAHLDFYQGLELFYIAGTYGFVHAGIRPGIPLRAQRQEDLLWIREDFTESRAMHELIIVHGHTIKPEVELLPNRIGIDTGAFVTGVLSCLVLEGSTQRLLQTGGGRSI
jgi:serine/threonine protein phosphatase 1